jgi:hypothetical protein
MHVYLAWYQSNDKLGKPEKMASEAAARAAVIAKYPTVTFRNRRTTRDEPSTFLLTGCDEVMIARRGHQPVAAILYPAK